MSTINATISTDTVPAGFCPLTATQWSTLVSLLHIAFQGNFRNFNYGNTEPSPDLRSDPWFRLGSDGRPDKIYTYADGSWISPHPLQPGSIVMTLLAQSAVPTFDGGEGNLSTPVTATSGPMWMPLDHSSQQPNSAARVFAQVGTLPSGAIITTGSTGGTETHVLSLAEMPAHDHTITFRLEDTAGGNQLCYANQNSAEDFGPETRNTSMTGSSQAHNNMPPYFGVRAIIRTARLYYRL